MSKSFMVNISESFDVNAMAEELTERYQAKGFQVRKVKMKNGVRLVFGKGCGGINMLLGLGVGITATCAVHGKEGDTLSVTFSDGDWTGKIVGFIAGWFLCFIPVITAIVGCIRQSSFPSEIENDIYTIVSDQE